MTLIPLSVADKILKKSGAKRVSPEAREKIINILEKQGKEIAETAVKNALFAGRKTIKKEDICSMSCIYYCFNS